MNAVTPRPGRRKLTSKEGLRRTGLGSISLGLRAGDLLSSRRGAGDLSSARGEDLLLPIGERDRPLASSSIGADLLRDLSISLGGDSSGELMPASLNSLLPL